MRKEISDMKKELETHTGQIWGFQDGQFISTALMPDAIESLLNRAALPATVIPENTPGVLTKRLALSFDNAQSFIEAAHVKHGGHSR